MSLKVHQFKTIKQAAEHLGIKYPRATAIYREYCEGLPNGNSGSAVSDYPDTAIAAAENENSQKVKNLRVEN